MVCHVEVFWSGEVNPGRVANGRLGSKKSVKSAIQGDQSQPKEP
jgi:hypothetical protein